MLENKINETVGSSYDCVCRTTKIIKETKKIGLQTIETFDDQNEKLDNISNDLNVIEEHQINIDKKLTTIESILGFIKNKFSRKKKIKIYVENKKYKKTKSNKKINHNKIHNIYEPNIGEDLMTNDSKIKFEKTNEMLTDMDKSVGELKNMMIDIGDEIDNQKNKINYVNKKQNKLTSKQKEQILRAKIII